MGNTQSSHSALAMQPVVMSYRYWRDHLGKGILVHGDETMQAVDEALRAYSENRLPLSLEKLWEALTAWRRRFPSHAVSMADPTEELYSQVKRVKDMPAGEPKAIADRLVYETRVGLLVFFANLEVDMAVATELFGLATGGFDLAGTWAGFDKKIQEHLVKGSPGIFAADVTGKTTSGFKAKDLVSSFETAALDIRLERRLQDSTVAQTPPGCLPEKLKELVEKIWTYIKAALGRFSGKISAYMTMPMGFANDVVQLLLKAIVPNAMGYGSPALAAHGPLNTVVSWMIEGMSGRSCETLAPGTGAGLGPISSPLHRQILDSVRRGEYIAVVESLVAGVTAVIKVPLHASHPLAAQLPALLTSLVKVIVRVLVRLWEFHMLKELRSDARRMLLESGCRVGQAIHLDKALVTVAQQGDRFDKWISDYLFWPAVGSLVLKHDVCDPATFYWVFDGNGYAREHLCLGSYAEVALWKQSAQRYLEASGARAFPGSSFAPAIAGRFEIPKSLRDTVMAQLPPPPNPVIEVKAQLARRETRAEYFALR
jgi:hypothetical protein